MTQIDLQLQYQNDEWLCHNDQFSIKAKELDDIDTGIKNYLKQNFDKGHFSINFFFDFADFPLWMRQYMPHYFNRNLIINLQ